MKNRRPKVSIKPQLAIVVDGQTEFWYFQMIKRHERDLKFVLKPEIPQYKSTHDQYLKVKELSTLYDKVYWIVDLDTVLSESSKTKKGGKKAIDSFLEYKKEFEEREVFKNVKVIINQPCLEYWFLIHFTWTTQQFSNCEGAGKLLRKFFSGYEKTEIFFTKENNDIYKKLKPHFANAIVNSKKVKSFDPDTPNQGYSDLMVLFKEIGLVIDGKERKRTKKPDC